MTADVEDDAQDHEPLVHVAPRSRRPWIAFAVAAALLVGCAVALAHHRAQTDAATASPHGRPKMTVDKTTGVVTGSIELSDDAGRRVHFTVTRPTDHPQLGQLNINGDDGTFDFVPYTSARLRASAEGKDDLDTYVVSISSTGAAPTTLSLSMPIVPARLAIHGEPLAVGQNPLDVAVNRDGSRVYVLCAGNGGTVSTIDTGTNALVNRPMEVRSSFASRFALSPDGTRLYVTDTAANSLRVIDTTSGEPVGDPIPVGAEPFGVLVAPDGSRAYTANRGEGTVSVIDTATKTTVGKPIRVGVAPSGLAVTPDGGRLYVIDRQSADPNVHVDGTVHVIDTASAAVIGGPVPVGVAPEDITIAPDGASAYVVNADEDTVSVIDTKTNAEAGERIHVGRFPANVELSSDGTVAYVTNTGDGTVSMIDTHNRSLLGKPVRVTATAPAGGLLYAIAKSSDDAHIYLSDFQRGTAHMLAMESMEAADH